MLEDATSVEAAADLGRRAADSQILDFAAQPDDVIAVRVREDENVQVLDLEDRGPAPRRARGNAVLTDPGDFGLYVTRLANEQTTVWADELSAQITAVFNDHDRVEPGWRDHTALLSLRTDPDWAAWQDADGKASDQIRFAEFLQTHAGEIVTPDAATLLEVVTSFAATRNAVFERGVRLTTGDVQLVWKETTTARAGTSKAPLEIPEQFTVRLAPYIGVEPVDLVARLKWRIRDGQLSIGYELHRTDIARREAFDKVRASVTAAIEAPVYGGVAPTSSVQPSPSTMHVRGYAPGGYAQGGPITPGALKMSSAW